MHLRNQLRLAAASRCRWVRTKDRQRRQQPQPCRPGRPGWNAPRPAGVTAPRFLSFSAIQGSGLTLRPSLLPLDARVERGDRRARARHALGTLECVATREAATGTAAEMVGGGARDVLRQT